MLIRLTESHSTRRWCKTREIRLCAGQKTPLEMLTSDFELLHCFVAFIFDFDFDWDFLTVEIELQTRTGQVDSVKVANICESWGKQAHLYLASVHLYPAKLPFGRAYRTS